METTLVVKFCWRIWGCYGDDYKSYFLILLCHPGNKHFRGTYHFHLQSWRVTKAWNQHEAGSKRSSVSYCFIALAYFWTPNMELICSSKMSGDFHWTTRHYYITQDNCKSCYFHFIRGKCSLLPQYYLSLLSEVWPSPDQAALYHILSF